MMRIEMVDHSGDKGLEGEEASEVKSCIDCGVTKTPLWQSSPTGPKTLCNACGIKSRKKRGSTALLGVQSSTEEKKAKKLDTNTSATSSNSSSRNNNNKQSNRSRSSSNDSTMLSQSLKKKLVPLGKEVVFERSIAERLRRRLGEEEQTSMLLLAIAGSCVY